MSDSPLLFPTSCVWSAGGEVKALATGNGLLNPATQAVRMNSFIPTSATNSGVAYGLGMAQIGPMYGHPGELPGYNSFMGYDPVNDVTMVIWANQAPAADGSAPAVVAAQKLFKYVYAPAESTGDNAPE